MNYSNNEKIFIPEKIENNMYNWRENSLTDAYVDFETIPNFLLENFNTKKEPISKSKGQFIFLIGVWYSHIPKIKQETMQTLRGHPATPNTIPRGHSRVCMGAGYPRPATPNPLQMELILTKTT